MKFFKFLDEKDQSPASANKIHYVKGEIIEVEDANPNSNLQCGSGIHCILFDGDKPIDSLNIVFGPRVAILEAEDEDVIYFSEYGKCRLKKAKVVDVYDVENLPEELKLGRNNKDFACYLFDYLTEIKYDEKWMDFVLKPDAWGSYNFFNCFIKKLDKHYPEFEDYLVNNDKFVFACKYACLSGKYHREELKKWVEDTDPLDNLKEKIDWIVKFGSDSNNFENNLLKIKDIDSILYYAVAANKDTKEIREIIKDNNIKYYPYGYEKYVTNFIDNDNIEEIAELCPQTSMIYARKKGKATPKMKEQIKKIQYLAKEYLLTIENDEYFYDSIYNDFDGIIRFFNKYEYQKDFVNKLLENSKYISSMSNTKSLTKFRNHSNSKEIDKIFLLTAPSLYDILSYSYDIKNTSNVILDYIKQTFTIDDVILAMDKYGNLPYFEQIFDLFGEEEYKKSANKNTKYFKVVKVLKNSSKVSAEFTKNSKMRKVYQNGGESKVVDKGMVFDNILSAQVYANLLSNNIDQNFAIFYCTGENFTPTLLTKKLNKNSKNDDTEMNIMGYYGESSVLDSVNIEIQGSGYLEKIELQRRYYNYW